MLKRVQGTSEENKMETREFLKRMTLIVVAGVLASALTILMFGQAAWASTNKADLPQDKILIAGLQPNQIVAAFQAPLDPSVSPALVGLKANSALTGSFDGKPVEVFVNVGQITTFYVIDPNGGYHWLGQVAPANSLQNIILSASAAGPLATKGLASPLGLQPNSAVPSNFTHSYTVVAGDTLGAIAKQHGTTISALAAANNLANPNLIKTGQVLMVP
jgi:nucleoid-associated protein YgaU